MSKAYWHSFLKSFLSFCSSSRKQEFLLVIDCFWPKKSLEYNSKCLILAFSINFCPVKIEHSGITVWPQASGFQNWPFLAFLMKVCSSICNRSLLRSQVWMRLFLWFSNIVKMVKNASLSNSQNCSAFLSWPSFGKKEALWHVKIQCHFDVRNVLSSKCWSTFVLCDRHKNAKQRLRFIDALHSVWKSKKKYHSTRAKRATFTYLKSANWSKIRSSKKRQLE